MRLTIIRVRTRGVPGVNHRMPASLINGVTSGELSITVEIRTRGIQFELSCNKLCSQSSIQSVVGLFLFSFVSSSF